MSNLFDYSVIPLPPSPTHYQLALAVQTIGIPYSSTSNGSWVEFGGRLAGAMLWLSGFPSLLLGGFLDSPMSLHWGEFGFNLPERKRQKGGGEEGDGAGLTRL